MKLALFDLDNTLLGGDSDYLWGQFLVEHNRVDKAVYARENQRFYEEYQQGKLDIHAFLRFQLAPLAQYAYADLLQWRAQFLEQKIKPIVLPAAVALVERHRQQGDTLVMITATNAFITAPIAQWFQIPHLLATEPEFLAGRYTGGVVGTPCFQQGKVTRLQAWLEQQQATLSESWFYSDSHNDLPLLTQVSHPVAVDPDPTLRHHAEAQQWPILNLR